MNDIEKAYRNMGYQCIYRAVQDYRLAKRSRCKEEIKALEDFFLSDEFKMYCDIDGEAVIKALRIS